MRENFGEEVGVGRIVGIFQHGGADGGVKALLDGEGVVIGEESEGLVGREAFDVFGERLRGDSNAFDFKAGFFECGFGFAQEGEGFRDLSFVLRAVKTNEGGDGADFGFDGRIGGAGCGGERNNREHGNEKRWDDFATLIGLPGVCEAEILRPS